MEIKILTFHTPINYGAILQAYALQKYLKKEYPKSEIKNIDFKTDEHIKKYNVFIPFRRNIILYLLQQFCVILRYTKLKKRKTKFKYFLFREFTLTERFSSEVEFLSNIPQADFYIVGSDQVFHPASKYLNVYYLNFKKGESKKIAYAPSFGISDFNEEVESKTKNYLADFDSLSCRENDGARFLSKVMGKEVSMVVDPVFLLTPEDWRKIAIRPKFDGKYIFVYDLNGGKNLIKIAQQIKKHTGYSIICQTQIAHKLYRVDQQVYDLGPEEFVGHMLCAEYVVTDSFHGTAFSILFEKKQYVYIARPKASSRIESLMNLINGQDRIFTKGSDIEIPYDNIFFTYDFGKIQKLIDESKEYLKNSINK